ncbi:uncharacterized protein LOC143267398 [Peromyscus maniculatus bairdii]|uniref:uncharacterized protein LOC143267398 n=1 Tax=Peromyscus maniculatus bairdii TaxID=230844 RepID=UPI003FCFCB9F
MAGEAAATRAVRRPAAAQGSAAAPGAAPGRPGGLRGSQEAAAQARRPRARVREPAAGGAREGRARGARGSAAVAAGLAVRAAGRRPAPWAGGCGGRPVPETRGRASRWRWRPRFDPVTYKIIISVVADDSE